jgi:hypothetical protein
VRNRTGALPANLPDHLRLLIKGCLEKDRRARISDIGVARFLLDMVLRYRLRTTRLTREGPVVGESWCESTMALAAGIALTAGGSGCLLAGRNLHHATSSVFDHAVRTSAYHTGERSGHRHLA